MTDPNRKLIIMLWTVITVLIVGGGIIGYMLLQKADNLNQTNNELTGNNSSLREQLRQAKATPTPSGNPAATPAVTTPSPSATPVSTATPKP